MHAIAPIEQKGRVVGADAVGGQTISTVFDAVGDQATVGGKRNRAAPIIVMIGEGAGVGAGCCNLIQQVGPVDVIIRHAIFNPHQHLPRANPPLSRLSKFTASVCVRDGV